MKRLISLLFIAGAVSLLAQSTQVKKFQDYDLIITDLKEGLAAWQVEITYDKKTLNITGIEGGGGSFQEPADYDSRGLTEGRIILAAYTLQEVKEKQKIRLARLHIYEKAGSLANAEVKVVALANSLGKTINGKIQLKAVNE